MRSARSRSLPGSLCSFVLELSVESGMRAVLRLDESQVPVKWDWELFSPHCERVF